MKRRPWSSMEKTTSTGLLWRESLQQIFFGEETFNRSSVEVKPSTRFPWGEPSTVPLVLVFYGEKTIHRFSTEKRESSFPFRGLLWQEDYPLSFFGVAFYMSSLEGRLLGIF